MDVEPTPMQLTNGLPAAQTTNHGGYAQCWLIGSGCPGLALVAALGITGLLDGGGHRFFKPKIELTDPSDDPNQAKNAADQHNQSIDGHGSFVKDFDPNG